MKSVGVHQRVLLLSFLVDDAVVWQIVLVEENNQVQVEGIYPTHNQSFVTVANAMLQDFVIEIVDKSVDFDWAWVTEDWFSELAVVVKSVEVTSKSA